MRFALYTMAAGLAVAVSAAPAMAFGRGGAVRGAAVGPAGGVRAGGVHGGTYTGPGGSTIQHVGGGGVATGPFGGVHAGAGGATRVTGPGGQSVTHVSGGHVTAGPLGGVSVGGGAGTAVNGIGGSAAVGHRGGVAVGPGGGVVAGGSRGGIAAGPAGGVVAGGSRGGIAATPWGGVAAGGYRGGVAIGPGGGVVAGGARVVGHTTGYMSPTYIRGAAVGVRTGYYPYFNRTWYAGHVGAWVAPRWVAGYNLWAAPVWTSIAAFCAITSPPVTYDYGSTVVIQDDNVYVNGDQVATASDYAAQADSIADTGRTAQPAENDDWQPLGVFGLIQGDEKVAQRIFQLAVNKDGIVRGNYYDAVADATTPVYGSVDKKTQRVAWSIGEKKDIVFETGLPTLTKDEGTILIHYGKDRTEEQMLVRLPEPKEAK